MSAIQQIKKPKIKVESTALVEKADYYGQGGGSGVSTSVFRGSGFEGAERRNRETVDWDPSYQSPDQNINIVKPTADARSRDMSQNDGYASGAVNTLKDNIVGSNYRLNAKPVWEMIPGATAAWAEEFQQVTEQRFGLLAESNSCYFDASRRNPFTELIRLAVGMYALSGEVLATVEWMKKRDPSLPIGTAVQMISLDRLSNPDDQMDNRNLRRGVNMDDFGAPISYWIRRGYPTEPYNDNLSFLWKEVPAKMKAPWNRKQVIHIAEQRLPDQTRGISDMVAALKQMRMCKQFQEVTLQNAVINASYAASIESDLPPDVVFQMMGQDPAKAPGEHNWTDAIGGFMGALNSYMANANNIRVDGAKIPHLFPGTKLSMKPMGTPGGVGTGFEESLLRYTAAALGLSYEEFSKDFSKLNYSTLRGVMSNTGKRMASQKKMIADRFASEIYMLYVEEDIGAGNLPMPRGFTRADFYKPLMREAFCKADWIGASRGQIDELKETEAAILRIKSGLSTYEIEIGRLGSDFRDVFKQKAREQGLITDLKLSISLDASPRSLLTDNAASDSNAPVQSDANAASAGS